MLKEIITQKDGTCEECGQEIPKGSRCYTDDGYESVYCLDCVAVE